ncbi:site-2 protease family protein [Paraliomyxa miuraensis]|uniref:site-2 protease family protein n=1 Tax=Paraliomyxa miuraensis TaxID=376150 RepID=UPI00224D7282|nr:site-2 protease family protein [Paraliomyxa miuraensis]MCX4239280.1 site-2 protease family protein [Paraliomyxa miuraensis]
MKWSRKLGRFAGIDTYVHASLLLLAAWVAWESWSVMGTGAAVLFSVASLAGVFASVLLHELGHALAARRYGIPTRRITLSLIGGVAQLEGMPRRPRQELVVALAGPAVNFAIAAGLWLVLPVFGSGVLALLLGNLLVANVILGVFNLLPAFPMDGGRALRAILAERMGSRRATETAASIGKGLAIAMGVVGLLWGPSMLMVVAVFVWFSANAEQQASRMNAYYDPGYDPGYDPRFDEVEVLGAPWRRGWTRPWNSTGPARPGPVQPGPVRVVIVRNGWWS